ncbi:MAG: C1 family peptidase [Acidobacteriota bacterium]
MIHFRRISLCLATILVGLWVETASAFPYPLGDIGKPADYLQTLVDYSKLYRDHEAFVDGLPSAFSWADSGMVSSPKDQGYCGGCWAFAAVGAIESKILMMGGPLLDLSEQQQISCNTSMYGCNGGTMSSLAYWNDKGPLDESCTGYPSYGGSSYACSNLSGCGAEPYHTTGYYTVNMSNIGDVKTSLYNDGPTYFRFDVYQDFYNYWNYGSPGQVYTGSSGSIQGGHAVLLIGWDDAKGAWLLKNSWGESGGPNGNGTFWMAYSGHSGSLNFGMANVQVFSTAPTPPGDNIAIRRQTTSASPLQVFKTPTTLGAMLGKAVAGSPNIGSQIISFAAGNLLNSVSGNELVVLTKADPALSTPNTLLMHHMPTTTGSPIGSLLASDPNVGMLNRYVAVGNFDTDASTTEVAIIKQVSNTNHYALYIFSPPSTGGGKAVVKAFDPDIGTNVIGLAAGNFDTDSQDELVVLTGGSVKKLYIFNAPTVPKGSTGVPIVSDLDLGSNVIVGGIAAGEFDGNKSTTEIALVRLLQNGNYSLSIHRAPEGINGSIGTPIARCGNIGANVKGICKVAASNQ